MREILFKAKIKDWEQKPKDEQWVYGYYVRGFNVYEEPVHMIFDPTTMFFSHGETDGWDEIDPSTLCQYTGLTDRNGNKIWENDVIQYIDEDLAVNGVVRFGRHEQIVMLELGFYVEWVSNEAECFKTDICYWVERRDIGVIGNALDNSELLKGE